MGDLLSLAQTPTWKLQLPTRPFYSTEVKMMTKTPKPRREFLQFRTRPEVRRAAQKAASDDGRSLSQYLERAMVQHLREHGYLPKDD